MKPVNIIVALTLVFLFSCDDDEPPSFRVTGVIIDESSREPIENVEIIGFNGGLRYGGNQPPRYGEKISLGTTDKCGRFKITLPDSIRDSYNATVGTIVTLILSRPDFGETQVKIPFKPGTQTLSMGYAPIREPYFDLLYLVQSEDGKSVNIGWNIHSLVYRRFCGGPYPYCSYSSDGNLHIQRSDSANYDRHLIPIEVNKLQMVTDGDLPPHGDFTYASFTYFIGAGPYGSHIVTISRTNSDTLFLVRPPEFPTLNHCN